MIGLTVAADEFDIVILNARVVDPETQFDDVANIGVRHDAIVTVTADQISGHITIDAAGLIAAPGFIDLHAHGQDPYSEGVSLLDGRTSQLDLEAGALPVSEYYAAKRGKSLSNYGVSVSHAGARLMAMDGIDSAGSPMMTHALTKAGATGNQWASRLATEAELEHIDALVEEGLQEGGLGIGVMSGYYPHADSEGIVRMARIAQEHGSFLTTHPRYLSLTAPSGVLGQQEMLSLSLIYDVPLVLHHVPTNALAGTHTMLDLIDAANRNGARVLAEAFPYVKGSSFIAAEILNEGWQERTGMDYGDLTWVETGESLTAESFDRYRRERPEGFFLMEHIQRKDMLAGILHPEVIIASDGMPWVDPDGQMLPAGSPPGSGAGHPRGAGTCATYLRIALDDGSLSLPEILAKTSYLPALFLQDFAPEMKRRERLRPGMLADITLFDPATVQGRADYLPRTNSLASEGIEYVLVNGQLVVEEGVLHSDRLAGKPIRGGRQM